MPYNRLNAVEYAHKWAFGRNPRYYDFSKLGGDCTNFISQCIHAGGGSMNYTPVTGWYYISLNNRTPSWSGVEFLYRFLVNNRGKGPYAKVVNINEIEIGDVIQLSNDGNRYFHSLLVVDIRGVKTPENILIATHTDDSDYRPLSTYNAQYKRYLHIVGTR